MKPSSTPAAQANRQLSHSPQGFALVVTLVLMVLLSILALGLLSLSAVELQNTSVWQNQSLARQNALLALNLAIGEIQKNLGPDKRTSATASLLDENANNPNWVGAWNTEGGFRGWLVSGNESTSQPPDPRDDIGSQKFTPSFASSTGSSVSLVGMKTLGPDGNPKDRVFAPTVDIGSSSEPTGRYAWWIGDEGTKANMAAPVLPLPPGNMNDRLTFRSGSPNRGFPTLGGDWKKWLPDQGGILTDEMDGKFVTRKQVALADSKFGPEAQKHFHDFTVSSAGVLSDSKNGGLRKDFSIAFEIPESAFKKSEFTQLLSEGEALNAYVTNHGSMNSSSPFKGRFTKTIVNYIDPQFGSGKFYRGPTFDILRDHYQLYRRLSSPFSPSASINAQIGAPNVPDVGKAPWREYSNRTSGAADTNGINRNGAAISDTGFDGRPSIRQLTTQFVPEVIDYAYTFALQSYKVAGDPAEYSRVRMIINPFIALYNPYNIVLKSPPVSLRVVRPEVGFVLNDPKNINPNGRGGRLYNMIDPYVDDDDFVHTAGYQTVDHYISDNGDPHPPASGAPGITLQPGEIKLYTITGGQPVDVDAKFSSSSPALLFQAVDSNNPEQLFASGIYSELRYRRNGGGPLLIKDGDPFYVAANNNSYLGSHFRDLADFPPLGNGWNEYFQIYSRLAKPFTGAPTRSTLNGWPEIKELRIFSGSYWNGSVTNNNRITLSTSQIKGEPSDPDGGARFYIVQADYFWKTAIGVDGTDNNFSLATHNPRAPEQSPTGSGGQGPNATRGPSTWTGYTKRLDGSRPNFDGRFWGTGKDTQDGGVQFLTLWDIPRKPITSLASLQHANVGRLSTDPAYIIGNSYASPYVSQASLARNSDPSTNFWTFDNSYLFNEALFDSYFFSGVNPGSNGTAWNNQISDSAVILGASDPTSMAPLQKTLDEWIEGAGQLANPRIAFVQPSGRQTRTAKDTLNLANGYQLPQTKLSGVADIRPHNAIAAFAMNIGAFNVNSVSEDAWRVILAGMRDAEVDHLASPGAPGIGVDSRSGSPFAGSTLPGSDSTTGGDTDLWNGFRRLSDDDIKNLAAQIVVGIRARAAQLGRPFGTLGEFVNRRIGGDSTLSGVLQEAIDNAGLNDENTLSSRNPGAADRNFITKKRQPAEVVTTNYSNPNALASSTIAGAPQWLTQADVLEAIGPQLSARSDTFIIRAYGETVNPVTGITTGRAWLEATVQRGTGFVDSSDDAALPSASLTSAANLQFGRRFNVIAFRWLSPEEI